jgi:hypothetical protein
LSLLHRDFSLCINTQTDRDKEKDGDKVGPGRQNRGYRRRKQKKVFQGATSRFDHVLLGGHKRALKERVREKRRLETAELEGIFIWCQSDRAEERMVMPVGRMRGGARKEEETRWSMSGSGRRYHSIGSIIQI